MFVRKRRALSQLNPFAHPTGDPFAPLIGLRWLNAEGDNGGGGTEEKKGDEKPKEDLIPRTEADRAFKARDEAKRQAKLLATKLGIDPDEIKLVPTGDKNNPFELEAPGLDEIAKTLEESRKQKRSATKWEDRERELQDAHQEATRKLNDRHNAKVESLEAWIKEHAVIQPLRQAAAEAKVIDPFSGDPERAGRYDDVIELLAPRVRVETEYDEDTGTLKAVNVKPLSEDKKMVMVDAKTSKPVTHRQLMEDFLKTRQHMRQSQYRNGPGAGGYGNGSGQSSVASNGNGQQQRSAVDALLGL